MWVSNRYEIQDRAQYIGAPSRKFSYIFYLSGYNNFNENRTVSCIQGF